jgi:hypothetical protein
LQQAISQLLPPKWGSQAGITGGGEITSTGSYILQTANFIPERWPVMLSLLFTVAFLLRRRR